MLGALLEQLYRSDSPYERSYQRPSFLSDDYVQPLPHVHFNVVRPRSMSRNIDRSVSSLRNEANKFQVMLNVKHFSPDEVDVKTVDNFVVIHGKHEEQADEHGFVSREFTRRYKLPDDVEPNTVVSSLSRDGVLTIQAPRKSLPPPKNERIVPITIQQPAAVEEAQKQQQQIQEQAAQQQEQGEPMQP